MDAARLHAIVVRLKGGDPLLFGRAQQEIAALEAAGIAYEVVPGITAALAVGAADGNVAHTARNGAQLRVRDAARGNEDEDASDWARGFAAADAGAIYMGAGQAAGDRRGAGAGGQTGVAAGGHRRERLAAGRTHRLHDARRTAANRPAILRPDTAVARAAILGAGRDRRSERARAMDGHVAAGDRMADIAIPLFALRSSRVAAAFSATIYTQMFEK